MSCSKVATPNSRSEIRRRVHFIHRGREPTGQANLGRNRPREGAFHPKLGSLHADTGSGALI